MPEEQHADDMADKVVVVDGNGDDGSVGDESLDQAELGNFGASG